MIYEGSLKFLFQMLIRFVSIYLLDFQEISNVGISHFLLIILFPWSLKQFSGYLLYYKVTLLVSSFFPTVKTPLLMNAEGPGIVTRNVSGNIPGKFPGKLGILSFSPDNSPSFRFSAIFRQLIVFYDHRACCKRFSCFKNVSVYDWELSRERSRELSREFPFPFPAPYFPGKLWSLLSLHDQISISLRGHRWPRIAPPANQKAGCAIDDLQTDRNLFVIWSCNKTFT